MDTVSIALPIILAGVLAAASPGVLEKVEMHRLAWGGEMAGPGAVRIAVEDCAYLGWRGTMYTELGGFPVHVTDCQAAHDRQAQPMHERGLVADVNWPELNGLRAVIVLRPPRVKQ